ncbi:GATA transcription factor 15-like [Syzygium oleosum]|uniref:GATA transcription factor 15-like n=1 Tax=Syzygium oleosum TaxID=219896 RepID=UPI0024BB5E0A|nr:GATA transcription factor 15-like [Syzygium oleosum]XP_056172598.1 GATA transcription factor 15-like [Syzygium oleosum]
MVFGAEAEEPLSVVEDDCDLRDDHAVPQFSAITEFDSPLEEKIMRKVNMEGKCIQKVSSQDLNDSDTSEAPLESLCNACGIMSRKKRRAMIGLNKIGMEIKKAKHSNNNNGDSLKRRVLA